MTAAILLLQQQDPIHKSHRYDYLYDMTRYDSLLHRGLEYLEESELKDRLTGKVVEELPEVKVKRVI